MFYQHNPVDCKWENMHWGHAVSSDVILVFYTRAGGTSEVSKGKPFTQNLAYSTDGGNTFVEYDKNPLIAQVVDGNCDPKVIYYEPDNSYIMDLYLDHHEYALYKSKNMLDWREIQHINLPEDTECPDFFPLMVDNDSDHIKWVFIGAADRYLSGNFDGEHFTTETDLMRLNYGNSSYAAQSWSDIPGRRIRTAFSTVILPGEPYASCINLPQELSLKTVDGVTKLCVLPSRETELLYAAKEHFTDVSIAAGQPFKHQVSPNAVI